MHKLIEIFLVTFSSNELPMSQRLCNALYVQIELSGIQANTGSYDKGLLMCIPES